MNTTLKLKVPAKKEEKKDDDDVSIAFSALHNFRNNRRSRHVIQPQSKEIRDSRSWFLITIKFAPNKQPTRVISRFDSLKIKIESIKMKEYIS